MVCKGHQSRMNNLAKKMKISSETRAVALVVKSEDDALAYNLMLEGNVV